MSKTYIPESVRQRVAEVARYRCGYCQTLLERTSSYSCPPTLGECGMASTS
jgi:hypothetical protein